MVSDIEFYRLIRYITILTSEYLELRQEFNEKFNLAPVKVMPIENIMENICKDFGLDFATVLEHSKLERWENENNSM